VLIVGRLEKNTRDSARRFQTTLRSLGAPVLGVVVNGLKTRGIDYGYGYYGYDSGSVRIDTDNTSEDEGSSGAAHRNGVEANATHQIN
jgi:Mrp family chromosome partitioning ATPase